MEVILDPMIELVQENFIFDIFLFFAARSALILRLHHPYYNFFHFFLDHWHIFFAE